jgi:hypothetical protein
MNTKQKNAIIGIIKNSSNLSAELKENFAKQISQMSEDELETFLKTIREAKDNKNLPEKISELRKVETTNHADFLQTTSAFLKKITAHETAKQEKKDKMRADEISNKIKSL